MLGGMRGRGPSGGIAGASGAARWGVLATATRMADTVVTSRTRRAPARHARTPDGANLFPPTAPAVGPGGTHNDNSKPGSGDPEEAIPMSTLRLEAVRSPAMDEPQLIPMQPASQDIWDKKYRLKS